MAQDDSRKHGGLPADDNKENGGQHDDAADLEDDLEETDDGLDEEPAVPLGLSGEEELDEIYEQRGGGQAQRDAEMRGPAEDRIPAGSAPEGRRLNSAQQLFEEAIPNRAGRLGERLHAALRGKILVTLQDSGHNYLLDWSGDALSSTAAADAAQCVHDCRISLRENDLLAVANGELNPQIGMLSHKISVSGRSDLAVYFFNILAS